MLLGGQGCALVTETELIDAGQTLVLAIVAFTQVYTLLLLRNEVRGGASALKRVLDELIDTRARLEKIEGRLDER